MAKAHSPRHGSMQFWPRVRAKRTLARVRAHNAEAVQTGLVGFAGYKAGMTHITVVDNRKNSTTKGEELALPVTIVEVPNLFVYGVRVYKQTPESGLAVAQEKVVKAPKNLVRRGPYAKKDSAVELSADGAADIRLLVATKPEETGTDAKTANVFEMAIAGTPEQQLAYATEQLGKEISVADAIKALDLVDVHAITTGKGFQGPVKRFGVSLRSHKSEKVKRGPGNLGAWTGNRSYRVAHAGQMGYHTRTELNKQILAILEPGKIEIEGGIVGYGQPKGTVLLIRGSIPGPKRRLIRMTPSRRDTKDKFTQEPEIAYIHTRSQQ